MKRMLLWILGGLIVLYAVLQAIHTFLPDWFVILWNADPKYIDSAIEEAKRTYEYDRNK